MTEHLKGFSLDTSEANAKLANLTGIRAYAALWVVGYHAVSGFDSSPLALVALFSFGFMGVDLFFVLSGLILSINYAAKFAHRSVPASVFFLDFLAKRLARIYPLHLLTFAIFGVTWVSISAFTHYRFHVPVDNTAWTALCNVLLLHAWGLTQGFGWNIPSWSVSAEWFAYLVLSPLLMLGLKGRSTATCGLVGLCLWVGFVSYVQLQYGGDLNRITTTGILRITPEFVAGFAAYRWVSGRRFHVSGDLLFGLGVTGLLLTCQSRAWLVVLLPSIVLILVGLYLGGTLTDALFGNPVATFLGRISYALYLVQIFIQLAARAVVRRTGAPHTAMGAIFAIGAELLVLIVIAYGLHIAVEVPARLAVLKRSGRLLARRTHPAAPMPPGA